MAVKHAHLVEGAAPAGQAVVELSIDNMPAQAEPYELPAAAAGALGGVWLAAVTPLVKAADVPAAAGEAPTKAEFDALRALANESKAAVNSIINATRAAGQAADK